MKKKILLFTAVIGIAYLSFSSYVSGPAYNGVNRSGAQASVANCGGTQGGVTCHGSASASVATVVTITVDSGSTTTTVTHYVPGAVYTIKIHGTNTSSNNFFGFEFASVSGSGASQVQAGAAVASSLPAHVVSDTYSGLNFIEHDAALAATSAGIYDVSFKWTAPTPGIGNVTLYCTLNAVNGDDIANAADQSNNTSVVLTQESGVVTPPASVPGVSNNFSSMIFPNPVANTLNLQLNDAQTGTYAIQVYDLSGRSVANENIEVNTASQTVNINTGNWQPGIYNIVVAKDGYSQTMRVVKQ